VGTMTGRTCLVTGGTSGIGRATAVRLAGLGAGVVVVGRDPGRAAAVREEIRRQAPHTRVETLTADLSSLAQVRRLAAEIRERCDRLDVLVNNAGATWGASIDEFPEAGWDKVMDTNVKSVFFLTQKLLPLLEAGATAEDPSRVINIGSIDGLKTPSFDTVSYGPSKAALHTLTSQLAAKLVRRNIIVNAIAPGPFPTWMLSTGVGTGGDVEGTDWDAMGRTMPRGRVGTPQDIAGLAIFLASRAGAFTVGAVITCDGGIVVTA